MGKNGDTKRVGERRRGASEVDPGVDEERWRSLEEAAAFLSLPVRALRDGLTKYAQTVDGKTEARFDGIVGRKVRGRWRLWLAIEWTAPAGSKGRAKLVTAESAENGGKESHHGSA